jgi:3-methyl-2-oxobutanoate hydroxymethyltransferase
VQGRDEADAARIVADAQALDQAGVGLMVLEMTTSTLARQITQAIQAPTIGIGAGPDCAGQVLVLYDMLGIYGGKVPKFARNFMQGAASIQEAVTAYVKAVKDNSFPAAEHGFD